MLRWFVTAAALGAMAPVSGYSPGSPAVAQPAAAERIIVPFNPPLGRPIVYRHTKSVTRGNETLTAWMDYRYTFSRNGAGFLVLVEPFDAGVENQPRAAQQAFRKMWERSVLPFTARLSSEAILEGLVDEDAYWERLIARTTEVIQAADPGGGPDALAFAGAFLRDMSADARRALLMQQTAPIFEFASTAYDARRSEAVEYVFDSPFGGTIEQQATVTITGVKGDIVTYTMAASVPREQLLTTILRFMERVPVTGRGQNTEEARARFQSQLRQGDMRLESEARFEVERSTGLARQVRAEQRVVLTLDGKRNEQRQVMTSERRN